MVHSCRHNVVIYVLLDLEGALKLKTGRAYRNFRFISNHKPYLSKLRLLLKNLTRKNKGGWDNVLERPSICLFSFLSLHVSHMPSFFTKRSQTPLPGLLSNLPHHTAIWINRSSILQWLCLVLAHQDNSKELSFWYPICIYCILLHTFSLYVF